MGARIAVFKRDASPKMRIGAKSKAAPIPWKDRGRSLVIGIPASERNLVSIASPFAVESALVQCQPCTKGSRFAVNET
jgi:hypothetical protein